jgi:hypothetical protein
MDMSFFVWKSIKQEWPKFITLFEMDGEVKFSRSYIDRFSNDIHKLFQEHGVHHTIDLLSKSAFVA